MSNWLSRMLEGERSPLRANPLDAMLQDIQTAPIGTSRRGGGAQVTAPAPGGFDPLAGNIPAPLARQGVTQGRANEIEQAAFDAAINFATTTPIRAFHGSPHRFDRFDMSKIGTGEGAQAYGHGLYFAGNEAVARAYRDGLSPPLVDGRSISEVGAPPLVTQWWHTYANSANPIRAALDDVDKALPKVEKDFQYLMRLPARQRAALSDDVARTTAHLNALRESRDWLRAYQDVPTSSAGSMYEVALRTSPERLLDWDKPLSAQPREVSRALMNVPGSERFWGDMTGGQIYESAVLAPGAFRNSPEAAARLRDAGIDGIQYLDAGSRAAGDGSRNYVMFRDDLIDILRRYGILGAMALGGAGAAGTAEARE